MADYNITSAVVGDVLVITNQGRVTDRDALAMAERHFELLLESNQTKILVDIRQLERWISLGEMYFLIRKLPVTSKPNIKVAIIDREENRKYNDFLQTTSANVGISINMFYEYAAAEAWLRGWRRQWAVDRR